MDAYELRAPQPAQDDRDLTPAERRRITLAALNNAPLKKYHIKTCLIAGAGFFTDSYDIFAINMCANMIGLIYSEGHVLTPNQDLGLKVATPIGTLVGQLVFGWLADVVGRKRMYGAELMLIIVATFGQVLAGRGPGANIFGVLVFYRFIMGVGIGGDYPLSAIIVSEFATTKHRGRMMNAVFGMQGFGNLAAAIVSLCVTAGFRSVILKYPDYHYVDYLWRIIIGLGVIPPCIALYYRLTIPETPRYTLDIDRNLNQAEKDADFVRTGIFEIIDDQPIQRLDVPRASRRDFVRHFSKWVNFKVLFGCAWSWFALDVAFYGLGLNSTTILDAIKFSDSLPTDSTGKTIPNPSPSQVYDYLWKPAVGNIIISIAGLVPGYWVSFLFIDSWGRRPIQLMGFILLTIIFIIMGFGYNAILKSSLAGFVVLFCLANFFQNFGPNTTTFIIPGEVFPTRYRSTCHGISAASGKLGAIVAQIVFNRLHIGYTDKDSKIDHILEIFALFMLTGIFSTLLVPETRGRSLEELNGEEDLEDTYAAYENDAAVSKSPWRRFGLTWLCTGR